MTIRALSLLRIELTVTDLNRAEHFYVGALGFQAISRGPVKDATARLLGADRIEEVLLRRGEQFLALQAFRPAGLPYPDDVLACDPRFQHFAMPTPDMAAAFSRLCAFSPSAISRTGPQALPARSGGATAYKFRDPDGHPLELIAFADGHGTGIDHSAIVVAETSRSMDFYGTHLGLHVAARQVNTGAEQDSLDGIDGATVEVVALLMQAAVPHIELLSYRPSLPPAPLSHPCDVAATRLVLACSGMADEPARLIHDPDGHALMLTFPQNGCSS